MQAARDFNPLGPTPAHARPVALISAAGQNQRVRIPRVFIDLPVGGQSKLRLPDGPGKHLRRVLRVRAGDPLIVFDGRGGEHHARVLEIDSRTVVVQIGEHAPGDRTSPLRTTLWQAVCRGGRMDYVVEKATELGVDEFVPVIMQRGVVSLDARRAASKRTHWEAVSRSACEQCGRNRVPLIRAPRELRDCVADVPDAARLMLSPGAATPLATLDRRPDHVVLLVGPEGGIAPDEHEVLAGHGFAAVSLGPRVLRSDTAGLAALSVLQARWGDAAEEAPADRS